MKRIISLSFFLIIYQLGVTQTTLVPFGEVGWKYLDNGSNQGTTWAAYGFTGDNTWKTGNASLGYGTTPSTATVVSYGTNAKKKYITTYFRKTFTLTDSSTYGTYKIKIRRDDGAVVYLNGTKVLQANMPGSFTYTTKASSEVSNFQLYDSVILFPASLRSGKNVIAVEIHQFSASGPDVYMDLELTAFPPVNKAPSANAGADQVIVLPKDSVTLTGGATDQDGTIASYVWSKIAGGSATIQSPASPTTKVTGLTQGVYTFKLVVTDNQGAVGADTVMVTVNANTPPVANAGVDQTIILPADSVLLSGSGTDADGTVASYAWTKLTGGTASIQSPVSPTTKVTGLTQGVYTFKLAVTDNNGATGSDTVVVTVNANTPPVANAGVDQTIILPVDSVLLSGSGTDADGTVASYAWTKLSGGIATIQSSGSPSTKIFGLTQGVYTFKLAVTDNKGATGSDTVVVTVNANTPPVANAGDDQSISLPVNSVALNGSSSNDPDGSIVSYSWTQTSGSSATIQSPGSASTQVSGLTEGVYIFTLKVRDNGGATSTDQVTVTVNAASSPNQTLLSWGSNWKYMDSGTNQGTVWSTSGFSDALWPSGAAELGYGDEQTTVLSYGPDPNAKYITTYFRKVINFTNPASYTKVNLNVKRDDGIIVYVNGAEVFRDNMPAGTVTYTTLASTACADDGYGIISATIPISAFISGANTIAVEIHQNAGNSSDISFDMELVATSTAALTRGPYLQMVSGAAATVRWRTDVATNSKLEVGTQWGNYTLSNYDPFLTTEHEVRISGLSPDTKYYYRFGSTSYVLQQDLSNYFLTAPAATVNRKVRVAVFGDCGRNDNNYQTRALSAYQQVTGSNPAELMLLLGDNAYNAGTDAEYQSNFFNVYSSTVLKNHALFPAPGNHDYANTAARQTDKNVPYYTNFSLPKNGECGGVASGTECYYSFDWGNIHFLSLDSYGFDSANTKRLYDTSSAQVKWIRKDLANNTRKWTVAYWHHPPYTMGSHNSDTETELVNIRQNFIKLLEDFGVDLILCGHSHDYERSYLLKGYYTNESSFTVASHAVTSSSGKYDGTANSCAYKTVSGATNHGTVYVVSGSAGASGTVQAGYPHNALPFAVNDGGMFYFDVDDNRLDAKFVRKDSTIYDQFTIVKDVDRVSTISISAGQSTTLSASWAGTYLWSNGATTRSITVNPLVTTSYSCSDGVSPCITDQFTVSVAAPGVNKGGSFALDEQVDKVLFAVTPVPVRQGQPVRLRVEGRTVVEFELYTLSGQFLRKFKAAGTGNLSTEGLLPGVYMLKGMQGRQLVTKRIVVTE